MCQTISHLSPTSSQVLLLCVFSDILGVTVRRTFIIPDPNLARQCTLLWQYEGGGSLRNSLKGNVTWKLQQSVLTNASLTRKCALQKVTTEKRSFFFFHEISHCSVFDKCFFWYVKSNSLFALNSYTKSNTLISKIQFNALLQRAAKTLQVLPGNKKLRDSAYKHGNLNTWLYTQQRCMAQNRIGREKVEDKRSRFHIQETSYYLAVMQQNVYLSITCIGFSAFKISISFQIT